MPTENTTCDRCGRPVADGAHACTPCVSQTRINLEFIAENDSELDVTLTRRDRVTAPGGGRGQTETPLPVNLRASEVGYRLRNTLTTWTRLALEERGTTVEQAFADPRRPHGPVCRQGTRLWCAHSSCRSIALTAPDPTNTDLAQWLSGRAGWIAHREWGPEMMDDIGRCAVDLARAIDTPPPMIALGTCDADGCDGELRAHQEAPWTHCPACGASYDVARRRDTLLSRAGHVRRGATELARILTALSDRDVDGRLIVRDKKWVQNRIQRGQLHPVGRDERGWPLYRLGDARRLHDAEIQKAILKQQTRATESETAA